MVKLTKNKIVYEENINNIKGKALAIVFPDNISEVKNLAKASEGDIIARGGGTSLTGALIPKNSWIIDFSKMNKILSLDISKKVVVVEPGILISELNDELEIYDLEFPIIPLFAGVETIGGMVAKNSSGNREIKYSRMINWIESLEIINGKGEQIKVPKSDLADFVGLEGTTGIIVQIALRLTTKKSKSLTILKAQTIQDIFSLHRKLRMNPDVCSIDLMPKEVSFMLGLESKYHLFVEMEGDKGNFKGELYEKYIKLKNSAYKKAAIEGHYIIENVKFLIDSLQDFIILLEQRKIIYFSHLASGSVYILFKPEDNRREEVIKFAKKLRGEIAYNFGMGYFKKEFLDKGELEIIRRIKNRHDPAWKLNRDKLIEHKYMKKNMEEISIDSSELIKNSNEILEEKTNPESVTMKRPEKIMTAEEKEKIKKLASGFFSSKKSQDKGEVN